MQLNNRICVYAGSFDGLTYGHLSAIEYGLSLPFDKLIVAIGVNPGKKTLFTLEERKAMLDACMEKYDRSRIETDVFQNLYLVTYCVRKNAGFYLRGLRGEDDFRFEMNMVRVNRKMYDPQDVPEVRPVWFPTDDKTSHISSSMAKALVGPEGWEGVLLKYLPQPVWVQFVKKFKNL